MVNDHVGRTDDYIANLISRKARSIIRHPGFTVSDLEDIKQELWLRLLERQKQFDPSRSSFPTFANRVITNRAKDILRDRRAQRRDPVRETWSINDMIEDGDGTATSRHETLPGDDLCLPEHGDLAHDIAVLRSKLDEDDQPVLDAYVVEESKRRVGKQLDISRRQVDNAISRMLDIAAELDLLDYLAD
jgi:RNA polymerase sigma factor (sigma-70 family)